MPLFDRQKWDAKYAAGDFPFQPSLVLQSLRPYLPESGRVIDVAGGAGRTAIWLAQQGLDVTIADVSPKALEIATSRAQTAGLRLSTIHVDLQEQVFPAGPWDLILSNCYLWRPLFAVYPRVLAPRGRLIVIQPTRANLQRHPKPQVDFLLDDGELPALVQGLQILHYEEGWSADGRHDAVLIADLP